MDACGAPSSACAGTSPPPSSRPGHTPPDMTAEMRWLRSPKVGVVSLRVRKQMSYRASLSARAGAGDEK